MAEEKKSQRRSALSRRRSLSREQMEDYSGRICQRLIGLQELEGAGLALSYMALWDEVQLAPLHNMLAERGVSLAFPLSLAGGVMQALIPKGPESWRRGRLGILEPEPESSALAPPEEIDLVLAPCVAFDETCMRLGHGAGYYDRYLPRCTKAKVIAVAFEAQRLDRVAHEPHDRGADMVVTEGRLIYPPLP